MIPRAVLILCEGMTEKIYFDAVIRNKRIARVLPVEVLEKQGQHKAHLVQHFEYVRIASKRKQLEADLSGYIGATYDKVNLDWFDEMIDREPARLRQAILNSERLDNHARPPFLTVQKLTARLLELAK